MQFTTASALAILAAIPAAVAVDSRFLPTGPFTMTVLAYTSPEIHYGTIGAKDGRFVIDETPATSPGSNSSCGNIIPTLQGGNGSLSIYSDSILTAQQVYVDISGAAGGLLSYVPENGSTPSSNVHDKFSRNSTTTISSLYNEGKQWIACPINEGSTLSYYVYSAADYSRQTKEGCLDFQIRTDTVTSPEACVFY